MYKHKILSIDKTDYAYTHSNFELVYLQYLFMYKNKILTIDITDYVGYYNNNLKY